MTNPVAIFVDLDGTLVETRAANHAAYAAALAEAGVTVSRQDFDRVAHGRNWRQFLPAMLEGRSADPAQVARRKTELYPGLLHLTVLNTGLVRLLEAAKATCPVALVTTASGRNAHAILQHHDLHRLFDEVVTGDDVTRHKPAPDAYHLAATRLGVEPARSLVIEDSDIGVQSGEAFGAPVLRVRMGEDA